MNNAKRFAVARENFKLDFYAALQDRRYSDMSDIYNEVMRFSSPDGTELGEEVFFTEVRDGNLIELPEFPKGVIHRSGKDYYYLLKEDTVEYLSNEFPGDKRDLAFDFLKEESIEAKKLKFDGNAVLDKKAMKQLELSIGDIVKITLFDDSVIIKKFQPSFIPVFDMV